MSKVWEKCPRCNSKKVKTMGKAFWFIIPIATGSCLIWVGLFFMSIWIIAFSLILGSPLGFLLPKMNQCEECKFSRKVEKKK